jgi:dTDP-4-amino-4,6-dideoxygalactose transaminase
VVVDDPEWRRALRRLRNGGQSDRYPPRGAGINSRSDEMQAALCA